MKLFLILQATCLTVSLSQQEVRKKRELYEVLSEENAVMQEDESYWSNMLIDMGSMSAPAITPPPSNLDSLARQIWADAGGEETIDWTEDDSTYPWYFDEPCIQHPTNRYGNEVAHESFAVALTKVFEDPRITQATLCDGMPVNSEANIPMSNCGDLVSFSADLLGDTSLVNGTVKEDLAAALLNLGFTCL